MVLSKSEIVRRIHSQELRFIPSLDSFQLQQHSIDLRLGFTFLIPKVWELTNKGRVAIRSDHLYTKQNDKEIYTVVELEEGQYFEILPEEYVIVATLEAVHLPSDLMGILYPRSSVNRRGLSVDLTGIVDAGFEGNLIVPVRNNTRAQVIRMYPGERFCQIVFEKIDNPVAVEHSRWHNKDVIVTIQDEKDDTETKLVHTGKITQLKQTYGMKD